MYTKAYVYRGVKIIFSQNAAPDIHHLTVAEAMCQSKISKSGFKQSGIHLELVMVSDGPQRRHGKKRHMPSLSESDDPLDYFFKE